MTNYLDANYEMLYHATRTILGGAKYHDNPLGIERRPKMKLTKYCLFNERKSDKYIRKELSKERGDLQVLL